MSAGLKFQDDWQAPRRLWSLWDMIDYVGLPLCTALVRLHEIEYWLKPVKSGNMQGPGAERVLYEQLLLIEAECERLGLKSEVGFARELREELAAGMLLAVSARKLPILQRMIERALAACLFFFVPTDDAVSFKDPVALFPKTEKAFNSARADICGAYRCRVLGEGTAAVFHCMGILQRGLYALAKDLNVSFGFPIEMADWQNIINNIEAKIKEEQNLTKSESKDQRLKFHSELAMQFRYFKDAWRNHVCHLREEYDPDQAQSIFRHVMEFMEDLSEKLSEVS
jgi:hypothetical protein